MAKIKGAPRDRHRRRRGEVPLARRGARLRRGDRLQGPGRAPRAARGGARRASTCTSTTSAARSSTRCSPAWRGRADRDLRGGLAVQRDRGVRGPANYLSLLVARASMIGMVVFDYAPRFGEAAAEIAGWMREGRLISREHIVEGGVDAFPDALLKLFAGENMASWCCAWGRLNGSRSGAGSHPQLGEAGAEKSPSQHRARSDSSAAGAGWRSSTSSTRTPCRLCVEATRSASVFGGAARPSGSSTRGNALQGVEESARRPPCPARRRRNVYGSRHVLSFVADDQPIAVSVAAKIYRLLVARVARRLVSATQKEVSSRRSTAVDGLVDVRGLEIGACP